MLYNSLNIDMRTIHTLTSTEDIRERVVIRGWPEWYVSQGCVLSVVPPTVQGEA